MPKIMSVLEKLNLVEKADTEGNSIEKDNNKSLKSTETKDNNISKSNSIEKKEKINKTEEIKEFQQVTNNYNETIVAMPDFVKGDAVSKSACNYEKNMTINEIYSFYELESKNMNTVFILDSYINALPKNLPQDLIKDSVLNILNASNINLNNLLSDGKQRMDILNKFMQDYSRSANSTVQQYKDEIVKLSNLINDYKEQIREKESMMEEQSNMVKYETEKINGLVDFFAKID